MQRRRDGQSKKTMIIELFFEAIRLCRWARGINGRSHEDHRPSQPLRNRECCRSSQTKHINISMIRNKRIT